VKAQWRTENASEFADALTKAGYPSVLIPEQYGGIGIGQAG